MKNWQISYEMNNRVKKNMCAILSFIFFFSVICFYHKSVTSSCFENNSLTCYTSQIYCFFAAQHHYITSQIMSKSTFFSLIIFQFVCIVISMRICCENNLNLNMEKKYENLKYMYVYEIYLSFLLWKREIYILPNSYVTRTLTQELGGCIFLALVNDVKMQVAKIFRFNLLYTLLGYVNAGKT